MDEIELIEFLRNCDKFYKFIEKDIFKEILEKIEFVIVEKDLIKFSGEDLATLLYLIGVHNHGSV